MMKLPHNQINFWKQPTGDNNAYLPLTPMDPLDHHQRLYEAIRNLKHTLTFTGDMSIVNDLVNNKIQIDNWLLLYNQRIPLLTQMILRKEQLIISFTEIIPKDRVIYMAYEYNYKLQKFTKPEIIQLRNI